MNKITTIASTTIKESLRDKIVYIFMVFGLLTAVIAIMAASISLDQNRKILIDFSLSGLSVFTLIISIFIGANLVHKEIDKKTIYFIFSKPVKPIQLIIGKLLGLGFVLFIINIVFAVITLLVIKVAVGNWEWLILEAILFNFFENIFIVSIVIMFSSFTTPIASSVYTFLIYLIGHSSDFIQSIIRQTANSGLKLIYQAFYYLLPNLNKYNIKNDIVFGTGATWEQGLLVVGYGLVYIIILLIITNTILLKREY